MRAAAQCCSLALVALLMLYTFLGGDAADATASSRLSSEAVEASVGPRLSATERELVSQAAQLRAARGAASRSTAAISALRRRVVKLEARSTPTFWLGLISGALLAALGQVLKLGYDEWVQRRRDGLLLQVAAGELEDVRRRAEANSRRAEAELEALKSGRESVAPMLPMGAPSLERLWREPPRVLRRTRGAISESTDLLMAVQHANDLAARRDMLALSGDDRRLTRLAALDGVLLEQLKGVTDRVGRVAAAWPAGAGHDGAPS